MENSRLERLLQKLLWLCAFVLGTVFLWASLNVFIADSELWSLSSSRYFWRTEPLSFALHYKPVFYALLNLFHQSDLSPGYMPLAARYLFALLGLIQVYLLYYLSQKFFKDRTASLLTVVIFMTTSFFLLRGYRIRSDYLATTFFLLSLACLTSDYWKAGWRIKLGFLASVLLMLASTPKAIYLLLLLGVFTAFRYRSDKQKFLIPTIVTLVSAAAVIILVPWLRHSYQMSLEFFLNTFNHPDQPPYFSSESFKYLTRLFKENPILSVLVAFHLYFCWKTPLWSRDFKALRWASTLTLIPMVFHNHRTPFFLLSLVPPLLIFSGKDFKEVLLKGNWPKLRYIAIIAASVAWTAYQTQNVISEGRSNASQIKYLNDLTHFLDELELQEQSILDVGGVLVHNAARLAYLGPSDENAKISLMHILETDKPEWILDSYRLSLFGGEQIINHIADNYVRLPGGLWRRAETLEGRSERRLSTDELILLLDFPNGDNIHLVFQTKGAPDSSEMLNFESKGLDFAYHTPFPLSLMFHVDYIKIPEVPAKVALVSLPFPVHYPRDSYSLFYFDTQR